MKKTISILISLVVLMNLGMAFAGMSNYCVIPPYLSPSIKPNILILIDYSGSMQFPAYFPCDSFSNYTSNNNVAYNCTGDSSNSSDSSYKYSSSTTYYGYFQPTKYYSYTSSTSKWDINSASSCNSTNGIGVDGCISGNLLNWATATRVDVMRMVMIGGLSTNSTSDTVTSEGAAGSYIDRNLHCKIIWAGSDDSRATKPRTLQITNITGDSTSCPVGSWSSSRTIAIPVSPNHTSWFTGVLQNMWNSATFEFMAFASNTGRQGVMRTGKTSTLAQTVAAIQNELPYWGTPTGEAMWEASDFFTQNSTHSYGPSSNANYISSGNGNIDPYYDYNSSTSTSTGVSCRKNFILLLTDGEWNGSIDPISPAWTLNTSDNRSDLTGTQYVKTYTVYCFGDTLAGKQATATTAMYGGFDDTSGTNSSTTYPYPFTNLSPGGGDSLGVTYPVSNCNSSGTWNSSCGEWDKNKTSWPFNFFDASDGATMQTSITNAINSMLASADSGTSASVLSSGQGSGAIMLQAAFYPSRKYGSTTIYWMGILQNLWYYMDPTLTYSSIREDSNYNGSSNKYILDILNDYIMTFTYDTTSKQTTVNLYRDTNGDGGSTQTFTSNKTLDQVLNLWEAGNSLWSRKVSSSGPEPGTTVTPRNIYTPYNSAASLTDPANTFTTNISTGCTYSATNPCSTTTLANWQTYLNTSSSYITTNTINYINGIDVTGVCTGDGHTTCSASTAATDCATAGGSCGYRTRTVTISGNSGVWKLGDILDSTPRFVSSVPVNNYAKAQNLGYGDSTYSLFYNASYNATTNPSPYFNRGVAFVGGNDGMLHAFNMGKLSLTGSWLTDTAHMKAKLCTDLINDPNCSTMSGTGDFGKELWAFIPKNAAPYLQYVMDPAYCHVFTVDGTPYIFDASISIDTTTVTQPTSCTTANYHKCTKTKNSWRTILIGSMRFGGACRDTASTCTTCVKTPASGKGYSSYFALDITNPLSPTLLWEFDDPALGYSTTGPTVVRIAAKTVKADGTLNLTSPDNTKNGRWIVIFGSGPTGPITSNQFMGASDQNMKLFVIDLLKGPTSTTKNDSVLYMDTGIQTAFAGSLFNASMDLVGKSSGQMDYQDDSLYLGFTEMDISTATCSSGTLNTTTRTCSGGGTLNITSAVWNKGGIMRLLINNNIDPVFDSSTTPTTGWNYSSNWVPSVVMRSSSSETIGPITTAIGHIQDTSTNKIWLFAGEGRFFYKLSTGIDDASTQRRLYGLTDPCFDSTNGVYLTSCLTAGQSSYPSVTRASLGSIDLTRSTGTTNTSGWYINLGLSATATGTSPALSAERSVTDPLATYTGTIFFTTFMPYNDVCQYGGQTYLWAVRYNNGAADTTQQGKALLQTSTGSISQLSLQTGFTANSGRTTTGITGMPPSGQGLTVIIPPLPLKKLLHKIVK